MAQQLLPPNSTGLEKAVDAAAAARLDALAILSKRIRNRWNAQNCPAEWLHLLAWAMSVDYWRSDWPEDTKRRVIAASPIVHRRKGTQAAIRAAVEAFGVSSLIRPWYSQQPQGAPYTFDVTVAGLAGAGVSADDLVAAINGAKSARDTFTLTQGAAGVGTIGFVGRGRPAVYRRLQLETI